MGEIEQVVKLSLNDFGRFKDDENPDFATARIMFLSTRPNSHGFILTEEVLVKYAPTIIGKFVIGNLNFSETDVTTHLKEPIIFGYIPPQQEIEFVRADDGYLDAYVDAVISKIYATKVYDLFKTDNFRNVSIEAMFRYMSEDSKEVESFNIAGVTILGKTVNPSVPQAHMEIIKFSADDAEKYYIEKFAHDNFETEVLGKLNLIYDKLNQNVTDNNEEVEEQMAKLEEKEKDIVMEKPTEEEAEKKDEKLSEETPKEDDVKEEKSSEDAEAKEEKAEEKEEAKMAEDEEDKKDEDDDVKDDDDKDDDKDEEKENLSQKLQEKEAECAELETKCSELQVKLSELEKFKADTEEKEKMSIVTQTLAEVKDSMNEEEYVKFEAKVKDYTLETINSWRNEVLANVATVLMSKQNDESHIRMNIENIEPKSTSVWDKL